MAKYLFSLILILVSGSMALAQETTDTEPAAVAFDAPQAEAVTTQHDVRIDGTTIGYTATAGLALIYNGEDEPIGQYGYTAYTKDDVDDASRRPIMFAYNGGPGSASIWLHMGVLGPRRIPVNDTEVTGPAPYGAINNEYSILDVADLVMMDPVGTGYARPVGEGTGEDFWGVDPDIAAASQFIANFLTEHNRWNSPKFILGESYGGIRTGGVAYTLLNEYGIGLNGIILVSPFMDAAAARDRFAIDLPHSLYFPTFAATAWYHNAVENRPDDLVSFYEEAKQFAMDEYAPALMKGSSLPADERSALLTKLSRYSGLSEEYWDFSNLRVSHLHFVQELLRDRDVVVGRVDSRFKGRSLNRVAESMTYDPFNTGVGPAFNAGFLHYYNNDLGFRQNRKYSVSGGVGEDWDWLHTMPNGQRTLITNTAVDLAATMTLYPHMQVLIQQGYFDLATPSFVLDYVLSHMDLDAEQRERIQLEMYESGHMMYVHPPSLEKFKQDLAGFVLQHDGQE